VQTEYAAEYATLFHGHWWWRARESFILDVLSSLSLPRGARILDVGCGDGLFFNRLSVYGEVEGVEVDGASVTPNGPWADRIRVQPFDESFDPGTSYSLVVMLDVLEHLGDPVAALHRALHLLEPGGSLLLTVPSFRALWTSHDDLNQHVTRYTRRGLDAQVRAASGEIVLSRYFFHWMFPAKLAARAQESVRGADPKPPRIPPRAVNETLRRISIAEQKTLSRLPVPFGSSLLAVVIPADAAQSC